jgi:hypothetical protein
MWWSLRVSRRGEEDWYVRVTDEVAAGWLLAAVEMAVGQRATVRIGRGEVGHADGVESGMSGSLPAGSVLRSWFRANLLGVMPVGGWSPGDVIVLMDNEHAMATTTHWSLAVG